MSLKSADRLRYSLVIRFLPELKLITKTETKTKIDWAYPILPTGVTGSYDKWRVVHYSNAAI